jgi:hypothetical protein
MLPERDDGAVAFRQGAAWGVGAQNIVGAHALISSPNGFAKDGAVASSHNVVFNCRSANVVVIHVCVHPVSTLHAPHPTSLSEPHASHIESNRNALNERREEED